MTYPQHDPERSDEVAGPVVSFHTCGCTATQPCPKAQGIFERRAWGPLHQHLESTFRLQGQQPRPEPLATELERLRRLNRERAQRGAA
jgi:hypothetical protein